MTQILNPYSKIFDIESPYSSILIGYNYQSEVEKDLFIDNNFSYYKIKNIYNLDSEIREFTIDKIVESQKSADYLLIDTIDSLPPMKSSVIGRAANINKVLEYFFVIKKIKYKNYKTIITTPVYRQLNYDNDSSVNFNHRLMYMADFAIVITDKIATLKDRYNYL
jgi:hypothetical protein